MKKLALTVAAGFLSSLFATAALAGEIASKSLTIEGFTFEVKTSAVSVPADTPSRIQTAIGGVENPTTDLLGGAIATAELRGDSLREPVTLTTSPGFAFTVPGLPEGSYILSDIRLVRENEVLQFATPAVVPITVTNGIATSVTVSQISPDELRARGITLDARNYDVFEYSADSIDTSLPGSLRWRTHVQA